MVVDTGVGILLFDQCGKLIREISEATLYYLSAQQSVKSGAKVLNI